MGFAPASGYAKAEIGKRFLAYLIDGIIAGIPSYIFIPISFIPFMSALEVAATTGQSPGFGSYALMVVAVIISFGWSLFYFLIRDGLGKGQSIGKRICGLMVIRLEDNLPCTKGNSAVRNLFAMFLNMIDIIVALIQDKGQRVGDMIVKTQVIEKP